MCGIAGLLRLDGAEASPAVLAAMTELLRHRGPDDNGTWHDGPVGLAHTRLSILDTTAAGHQPMAYGDGRYRIVFNGEVYNFIEVRDSLRGLGHTFRTESDTEVVLAAYAEWGEDCLYRFNGMWGLAIWDAAERRLFLARDRFGVKPLYYWFDGKALAFSSELKGLLAVPEITVAFDPRAVATAVRFTMQAESTEPALIDGARRLLPGRALTVDLSGRMSVRRWWRTLDHLVDIPPTEEGQVARFRELFADACAVRLRSDVPLATTLSGGLDSSSVHAMLARMHDERGDLQRVAAVKPTAFVGMVEDQEDETEAARRVVRDSGSEAVYTPLDTGDALSRIPDLVYASDEISYLFIGQWSNYRELRRGGFKVSLDGHGADELTAGYVEFPLPALAEEFLRVRDLVRAASGMMAPLPDWISKIAQQLPEPLDRLNLESLYWRNEADAALTAEPYDLMTDSWRADSAAMASGTNFQRRMYYEFHEGRQPWILREFDRASMAHGIEVRSPFLDWRLAVYAFSLPAEIKFKNGYAKYVLRQAMAGVLHDDIRLRRKKVGFPLVVFKLAAGTLRPLLTEVLESSLLDKATGIDAEAARAVARDAMDRDHMRVPWLLVHSALLEDSFRRKAAEVRAGF